MKKLTLLALIVFSPLSFSQAAIASNLDLGPRSTKYVNRHMEKY